MALYSIRIRKRAKYEDNCYLAWAGGTAGFYETTKEPTPIFSLDEVEGLFRELRKKYIYKIEVEDVNGCIVKTLSAFKEKIVLKNKKKMSGLFKFN